MKILALRNNLTIDLKDDLQKVTNFFKRRANRDFIFDIKNTSAPFVNFDHLFQSNASGYDAVIIYYDRIKENPNGVPQTFALYKNTGYTEFPAGDLENNAPDYLWNMTAHELMHICFKRCLAKNIFVPDPMDIMYVNGILEPYYKEFKPDDSDSNFSTAFARLKNYWGIIDPMENEKTVVTLIRQTTTEKETLGTLEAINGDKTFTCKTLELPWKENQQDISCIPNGTYDVKMVFWPKHLKWVYALQNVPDRTGILIHSGNFYTDILGCILLGVDLEDINGDGQIDVGKSQLAIDEFQRFMENKEFTLEIK